jgi:hypothetical protein
MHMPVRVRVCMLVCIFVCVCMYECVRACIYVCKHSADAQIVAVSTRVPLFCDCVIWAELCRARNLIMLS